MLTIFLKLVSQDISSDTAEKVGPVYNSSVPEFLSKNIGGGGWVILRNPLVLFYVVP
jgi:hypothetical protein